MPKVKCRISLTYFKACPQDLFYISGLFLLRVNYFKVLNPLHSYCEIVYKLSEAINTYTLNWVSVYYYFMSLTRIEPMILRLQTIKIHFSGICIRVHFLS